MVLIMRKFQFKTVHVQLIVIELEDIFLISL